MFFPQWNWAEKLISREEEFLPEGEARLAEFPFWGF